MLRWKPGPKAYDGIWGVHWYKEINKTSGFIKRTNTYSYKKDMENFSKKDKNIIDKANRYYLQIIEKKYKLKFMNLLCFIIWYFITSFLINGFHR